MNKTFKAKNISCGGCATLIINSLKDDFGIIDVNLDTEPKEVSLEIIHNKQEVNFKAAMLDLGFEVINDQR